jgi:DNA primase
VANAKSLFDYKLTVSKLRHGAKESEGKARICQEMLPTINKFKDAVLKSEYLRRLADELMVREEALLEEIKKIKTDKPYAANTPVSLRRQELKIDPTEKLLIKMMLDDNDLIDYVRQHLEPSDLQEEAAGRIVAMIFDMMNSGKAVEVNKLVNYLDDPGALECIYDTVFDVDIAMGNKEHVVNDCIKVIKRKKSVQYRQRLQEELQRAEDSGDEENVGRIRQEFCNLIKKGR